MGYASTDSTDRFSYIPRSIESDDTSTFPTHIRIVRPLLGQEHYTFGNKIRKIVLIMIDLIELFLSIRSTYYVQCLIGTYLSIVPDEIDRIASISTFLLMFSRFSMEHSIISFRIKCVDYLSIYTTHLILIVMLSIFPKTCFLICSASRYSITSSSS